MKNAGAERRRGFYHPVLWTYKFSAREQGGDNPAPTKEGLIQALQQIQKLIRSQQIQEGERYLLQNTKIAVVGYDVSGNIEEGLVRDSEPFMFPFFNRAVIPLLFFP